MDSHKHLHFKTFVMILIMIIAGPLGNVLLGKGMKSVGTTSIASFSDLLHVIGRVFAIERHLAGRSLAADILCRQHSGPVVGGLQLRAAGLVDGVWCRRLTVGFRAWRGSVAIALGRHRHHLHWASLIVGRTHPRTTEHR